MLGFNGDLFILGYFHKVGMIRSTTGYRIVHWQWEHKPCYKGLEAYGVFFASLTIVPFMYLKQEFEDVLALKFYTIAHQMHPLTVHMLNIYDCRGVVFAYFL
jgi:hypothetical protein